jgi:hypothetical protein
MLIDNPCKAPDDKGVVQFLEVIDEGCFRHPALPYEPAAVVDSEQEKDARKPRESPLTFHESAQHLLPLRGAKPL